MSGRYAQGSNEPAKVCPCPLWTSSTLYFKWEGWRSGLNGGSRMGASLKSSRRDLKTINCYRVPAHSRWVCAHLVPEAWFGVLSLHCAACVDTRHAFAFTAELNADTISYKRRLLLSQFLYRLLLFKDTLTLTASLKPPCHRWRLHESARVCHLDKETKFLRWWRIAVSKKADISCPSPISGEC